MAIMIRLPKAEQRLDRFSKRGTPRSTKKALAEAILNRAACMDSGELYSWLNDSSVRNAPPSNPSDGADAKHSGTDA